MAEVFRGTRLGAYGFERTVAIKRILPALAGEERFVQMFIREALILGRMIHPNIVNALEFDRGPDDQLCLVLEFVDGVTLADLIKTAQLSNVVIAFIVREILRGIGYAHQLPLGGGALGAGVRGIVHRDLSPHNVLLSWDGGVKVADFGVAKARVGSRVSSSRDLRGKVAYMSPEQLNGKALDGRSDLFAVGVMLWEMLTGERLFNADSTGATVWRVLSDRIIRPGLLREVPADLESVAMRLLERDPAKRFPSAEAACDALAECADASGLGCLQLERLLGTCFPQQAIVRRPPPFLAKMRMPVSTRQSDVSPLQPRERATPRLARLRLWLCRWCPMIAIIISLVAGSILLRPSKANRSRPGPSGGFGSRS